MERLAAFFIPVANAQWERSYVFTLTFTITEETPITGISNILFLPGIQASRLYTTIDGAEERVWEPFGDDEVEMLRMTDTGESVNDVYTKDIVDELPDGSNIYKGFIQHLIDLGVASGDSFVTTFPYDWRHDVFDIVENGTVTENGNVAKPLDIIATSASISPTHKVTLIAHSNGGLLAKAIMLKLKEEGKENLVDKVIFIATPHIGTPKGLAALLHGYDQQHALGIVSTDEKVRSVMKNMSGAYGLLPSESYVSSLTEPMISFDDSSTTKPYRDAYGFTLTNMDEYTRFLNGTEGRADAGNRINEPSTANATMLASALLAHKDKLDTWTAPEGVEVFNIVGTGLPTPKSIEYKEFMENTCNADQSVCIPKEKLEGVLHFTNYGDETVVSKSSVKSGSNLFVNLKRYNEEKTTIFGYSHADIVETEATQDLVDSILHGSTTEGIEFASTTEPTFLENTDIFTIHSPARIYLRDTEGNITGRTEVGGEWKSEIPGSTYLEAGSVKYVLVPSDASYDIVIEGEGNGIYTHTLTTLHGDTETESIHHTFTASITPTMVIEYKKTGDTFTNATIDTNGDGTIDDEMTLEGIIIEKVVTYADLTLAIRTLSLPKAHKTALLALAKQAEQHLLHPERKMSRFVEKTLLLIIQKSVERFETKGMITGAEKLNIDRIINKLIK
jgi:pimeloyl-ACP methyl ester carboxylesterase